MKVTRAFLASGVAATLFVANLCCCSVVSHAQDCCGGGSQFVSGTGARMADVSWDATIPTPVERPASGPDGSGKKVGDKPAAPAWTVKDLEDAKPLLVYYFVEGLTDPEDESCTLSRSFETAALANDDVVTSLQEDWRAKRVALDAKKKRKEPKDKARLEFWSFTNVKLGEITTRDDGVLAPKRLLAKLSSLAAKNSDLCKREIERIEAEAKREEKEQEKEEAAGGG